MDGLDDLVKDFLVESYENLDRLDQDFVALETDPTAQEKLGSIFRTIHTIKGTCGCLGFPKLEAVAHVGENLLSRLRDRQLTMDSEITTGLLRLVDAIREILGVLESTGQEGDKDYSAVRNELIRLNERPSAGEAAAAPVAVSIPADVKALMDDLGLTEAEAREMVAVDAANTAAAQDLAPPAVVAVHMPVAPQPVIAASVEAEHEDAPKAVDPSTATKAKSGPSVADNAIRVDVNLLDKLMNLVGELVLARNQVVQYTASQKDATFLRTAQRLNLITSELQEGVMKTRMQPIGSLWNKFPRIVRDVANACQKKVRIEMEGHDTELDKTILEAIKDPLTHVIRNSVDHGVEAPAKRLAAGKVEEGRIFMRAFHEGGQVNIEIVDDGKGIDPEIIKRKAVEKGLITAEQAAKMSEREATNLIFAAGFSTAEKVTNVSGRGVGMDVVKTNVEKIGGVIDIKSKVGGGTTLRIKIPLTLAIIPALIVTSAGERFAIPQVSLLELVRIDENEPAIETIGGAPVYRLRGNLLPLAYLNRELSLSESKRSGESSYIVVLRCGERRFGLVVDSINDTEEIVVKPLGKAVKSANVFAGATIMGDGKVSLILDVLGLAHRAGVINEAGETATSAGDDVLADGENRQMLLLFELAGGCRMAIPLSSVARLEEFPRSALEVAGTSTVIQYRGEIMPLVDVAEALGDRRAKARGQRAKKDASDTVHVIVHNHNDHHIGLRVGRILDAVNEVVDLQEAAARHGVLGTAIIKDKITELLDVDTVITAATDLSLREAA